MQPVHENRLSLRRFAAKDTVLHTPSQQLLQSRLLLCRRFRSLEDSVFCDVAVGVQEKVRPGVGLLVQEFAGAGEVGEVAGVRLLVGDASVVGVDLVEFSVRDVRGVEARGDVLDYFMGEGCEVVAGVGGWVC